ncbi:MAG: hypothetical protein QF535_21235 [Anaerolineales bacterium]|nr:hypothetical protein [Anaerolineales bacterium]
MDHVLVLALLVTEEFTVRSDSLVPAQTFIARMAVPLQEQLDNADVFALNVTQVLSVELCSLVTTPMDTITGSTIIITREASIIITESIHIIPILLITLIQLMATTMMRMTSHKIQWHAKMEDKLLDHVVNADVNVWEHIQEHFVRICLLAQLGQITDNARMVGKLQGLLEAVNVCVLKAIKEYIVKAQSLVLPDPMVKLVYTEP